MVPPQARKQSWSSHVDNLSIGAEILNNFFLRNMRPIFHDKF